MAKKPMTEEEIRVAAYHLWLDAGSPQGRDLDFWFQAETFAEPAPKPARKPAAKKPAAKKPAAKKTATTRKTTARKPAAKTKAPAKSKSG